MQYSNNTRNRELHRLTQPNSVLKFEVNAEFVGLKHHPSITSTQIKCRTSFPSPFPLTGLQYDSTHGPMAKYIACYNTIFGLKNKTTFSNPKHYSL